MSDKDTILRKLTFEDIETFVPCDLSNDHVLFLVRTANGSGGWYRLHREDFRKLMAYLLHDATYMKRKNLGG